ncbi:MAG: hypothetical protein IPK87_03730 [Planctomycetes bacterium]|nr:hypothetical protein [Planctomycetota bacterium]
MRSTLTIFVIGFVLGSSLGIGGLWTQVVQPTKAELEKIEQENGIMQKAVETATQALKDAAKDLRADADVTGASVTGPTSVRPTGTSPQPAPVPTLGTSRTRSIADTLDSKAAELEQTRTSMRTVR